MWGPIPRERAVRTSGPASRTGGMCRRRQDDRRPHGLHARRVLDDETVAPPRAAAAVGLAGARTSPPHLGRPSATGGTSRPIRPEETSSPSAASISAVVLWRSNRSRISERVSPRSLVAAQEWPAPSDRARSELAVDVSHMGTAHDERLHSGSGEGFDTLARPSSVDMPVRYDGAVPIEDDRLERLRTYRWG